MAAHLLMKRFPVLVWQRTLVALEKGQSAFTLGQKDNKNSSLTYCAFRYFSNRQQGILQEHVSLSKLHSYAKPLTRQNWLPAVPLFTVKMNQRLFHTDQVWKRPVSDGDAGSHREMEGEQEAHKSSTKASTTSIGNTSPASAAFDSIKQQKKAAKSSAKEFTIKGNISQHDLSIKLRRIKELFLKGKTISVRIIHSPKSSEQDNVAFVSRIHTALQEAVQEFKVKVKKENSKEGTSRFSISVSKKDKLLNADSDANSDIKQKSDIDSSQRDASKQML